MCCSTTTAAYILFILTTTKVLGEHIKLIELIEKIHVESDSATVFFFGIDNDVASYFIKTRTDIPVAFFNSNSQLDPNDDHRFFSNAILVIQSSWSKSEILDFTIQKLHTRKFVIINAYNLENLDESFSYFFKEKKFTRLYGIVSSIAYAYLPYANVQIEELNLTSKAIPNALDNLNRYSFRTVAKEDLPRVFWYTNKFGQYRLGGYVGQFFRAFLMKHNATMRKAVVKKLDKHFMMAVINATFNNEIDISLNVYQDFDGIKLSYPLKMMNWFIVTPIIGNLNPNQYFLRPFSLAVWIGIGLSTVYIIVMDMVKNKFSVKPISLWKILSRNYLMMLALPPEKPIIRAYRFHGQVFLFAFILVNVYLVYLTSFLTVFIKVKQHKTIRDLVDNQVPVMMVDYEWKLVSVHKQDLAKIVLLVDYGTLIKERNSMKNLNFAYALGTDKANFFIDLQKYPKYHIIYESLRNYYLGFIMVEHSHFIGILNDFIIKIMDTGLFEKWYRDGIALIKEYDLLVLKTTPNYLKQPYPLSMFHLNFAWVCLIFGLAIAIVVFIVEILLFRHRQRRLKIKN